MEVKDVMGAYGAANNAGVVPLERDWKLPGYAEPGDTLAVVAEPDGRTVSSFKDLWVWSRGMELTKLVYALTAGFPREEQYGLTSQLRRAAVSVPSNIAEGWARNRTGYFQLGMIYARGSLAEIETQVLIAIDQAYITKQQAASVIDLANGISAALLKFINTLEPKKG